MNITTALTWLIMAHLIQGIICLPIDRELFRVKRKGEGEIDNGEELVHKVRRSQDEKETEIRHKRRFFAPDTTEHKTLKDYKTKMEARSSRSSREDNDITAKRPERFRLRIHKRSHDESSLIKGDVSSGSGEQPQTGTSGSGLWSGPQLLSKKNDKRSTNSNSLDTLIATLRAISSLTPEEHDINSDEEIESSGSGLWLAPENAVDDKLPQFFKEEAANSGSGESAEKALSMLSEKAEMELSKNEGNLDIGLAQSESKVDSEETQERKGETLLRREVRSDSLADDLTAAAENEDKSDDSEQEDRLTQSSGTADDAQVTEDETSGQPEADKANEQQEADKVTQQQEVDKVTQQPEADKVTEQPEEDKATEQAEENKASEQPEAEKVTEQLEEDKVTEQPEEDKATKQAEADKVTEQPEADKVTEQPEVDKATEQPEADKATEQPEVDKVTEQPEEDKVNEQPEEGKVTEQPEEDKATKQPEAEKVTDQPEEDKVNEQPEEDKAAEKPEANNVAEQPEVDKAAEQAEEDKATEEPEVKTIRSITDVLLPDEFYRAKRSSQENALFVSENNLGVNDALISNSLVARFYRDQDALVDAPEVMEASVASLPSETEAVTSPEKQAKPVKRETYYHHSGDYSEPRVVYTREISDAREPIIERPAVFSQSNEDSEMDSSFGGDDDDDDEATLMIHEREIREDGYVGCYEDKSPDRDLPTILSVPSLTPDKCRSACQGAGHAYAGVQYGYLCRCGDSYGKYTKVSDEDCNARCVGDHAQKCGGFWRSAVFTTAGAMEPSKRGNFFHIESVQPMTEDMFDIPRSEIASGDDAQEDQSSTITESALLTAQAPELPEPAPEATTPESSGAYIQEIQHEIPLQESPVPSTPAETVKEDDSVAHASGEDMPGKVDASTPHAHESEPANNPEPAHTPEITSAPAISPQPPAAQDSIQSETKPSSDSSVVTNEQAPRVVHPQHDQAPQGTHVSQLVYLHQQQDILSKPTPKTIIAVAPGKMKAGTVAYTGTIKLKQSWLDQFEDANSAESKILTGNIEQAFKRVFKNEPKFVNAEIVGFREGLVKHNPNTIRKVIAPFILTFKNDVNGIKEKLKNMVQNLGRLDDMPVYKHSLQIAEYGHSPAAEKAQTVNETSKGNHGNEDEKRSAINVPNGGVDPYLKGIFSQISM